MIASVTKGTKDMYNSTWESWWNYCRENNIAVFKADNTDVLEFLSLNLTTAGSYSTMNTRRSALSFIMKGDLGQEKIIKRFFRGVDIQMPPRPKYDTTWNPKQVLDLLGKWYPNSQLTLEKLTQKVAILLTLTTGQRIQTISKIKIENISGIIDNRIRISIPDRIKTTSRNRPNPLLELPIFSEKPELRVASAVLDYIDKTRELRSGSALFITFRKPHHTATKQTISKWVKSTMKDSGIDTAVFGTHSTRHASTSAAYRGGIRLETIKKSAGWTEESQVFAKFYNLPLQSEENLVTSVLQCHET